MQQEQGIKLASTHNKIYRGSSDVKRVYMEHLQIKLWNKL